MEGAWQKRRPWKRRGPLGSLLLLLVRKPLSVLNGGGTCALWWRVKPFLEHSLFQCMFSPAVTLLQGIEEKECPIGDFLTEEGICCNKCSAGKVHTLYNAGHTLAGNIMFLMHCWWFQVLNLWKSVTLQAIEVTAQPVLMENTQTRWTTPRIASNADIAKVEQLHLPFGFNSVIYQVMLCSHFLSLDFSYRIQAWIGGISM